MKKRAIITLLPYLMIISSVGIFTFSLVPGIEKNIRYLGIFLSGIIPILLYHYFLKRQQSNEFGDVHLTDSEVDSIYYFGFVVTLLTLISSIITLGISNDNNIDLQTIGIQFGLGLFVTAYALIARLHLQVSNDANIEPEDAYANYVDRVNGLLGRVDVVYADLDELLKRLVDRLRTTLETESAENANRISRQIEEAFTPILDACQKLGERIGDQGLSHEIESMRSVLASTNKTFKQLETRLETLSQEADKSIEPISNLGIALLACENGGKSLSKVLTELKFDPNITKSLSESVENISLTFKLFSTAIQKIETELGKGSSKTIGSFEQFNSGLLDSTNYLSKSMGLLAEAMANSSITLTNSLKEATSNEEEK